MIFNILSYFFSVLINYIFFRGAVFFTLAVVLANCITFSFSGFLITAIVFIFLFAYVLSFFFKKTDFKKILKIKNA